VGVQEYRKTIPYTVRPDDAVLEVGCHFGTSTALIQNQAQYCIGVDVGSKIIREAHKRHPGIYFRVGDAWKTAELLRIQQDYYQQESQTTAATARKIGFDVVYVDVGGLSGCDGLLEAIALVNSIRYALEPRCIVIKSLCMQRLSSRLVPFWQSQKRRDQLGGASETKFLVGQDRKEEGRAAKS
jgi:SAM-dependent methyltransferase